MKASIYSVSLLCLFFMGANVSSAVEVAPETVIQEFLEDIRAMEFPVKDKVKHDSLVTRAHSRLDIEGLSKLALASHWETVSREDQLTFTGLLRDLIAAIAYKGTHNFMGDHKVVFSKVSPIDGGFEVTSVMPQSEQGLEAEVLYHVRLENGTWQIYDIFLDGISITEDLQYQWDQLIDEKGFAGLLERMREKLAEANAKTS